MRYVMMEGLALIGLHARLAQIASIAVRELWCRRRLLHRTHHPCKCRVSKIAATRATALATMAGLAPSLVHAI